ncbi:hypothetical protein TWF694_011824 [Orbilia ellipsospora]|uniref:DNA mismatch repair protein PMS1 n=1 Tax=Orbilia ellipsospora TaxID=2528407 RepID=A0AAV9X6C4_9PEZI
MSQIKAIEGRSVHQIQSGQVISDGLCSAVKELVENSIDAHATSIEVKFKNHGLELIEITDNGDGITPDNFDKLALKHYTSKLRTYEDLERVTTYGFRGEALSSLCALSNLFVTTATAGVAPKGTKIEFHTSGVLKSTSVMSHPRGTTVSVETLFKNLPVRKQELERNIKREFARVVSFLQAYAIVCVGVKFTVYNHPPNGKKTLLFSTKANKTTKENIANVFGAKALANLIPLDLDFEMTASNSILNRNRDDTRKVKIIGHISRPVVGEGRQAPDRQLFFVNSRPCNLPQVARAINEVYKSYNLTQSPFVFADLQLDTTAYDVNVSPDKRTILLHDQANLLESLKVSLTELFDNSEQTVPVGIQSKLGSFKTAVPEPSKIVTRRQSQLISNDEDENEEASSEALQFSKPTETSAPQTGDESEDESEPPRNAFSTLMSRLHQNETIDRSRVDGREKSKNGLTYEQKGKISKAFASRQSSHVPGGEAEETLPDRTTPEPTVTANESEDEETDAHPPSQATPRHRNRSSPHPTTVTIGNKTATSTPRRSPSKALHIIPTSSPSRRAAARNSRNSLLKKLQGFSAPGTQSSLSLPENDLEESDEELATFTQEEQDAGHEPESGEPIAERPSRWKETTVGSSVPPTQSTQSESLFIMTDNGEEGEGEAEEEGGQVDKRHNVTINSDLISRASERVTVIPPSSPPRRPEIGLRPIPETNNNEENGTEEQHRDRERRTVDRLIAEAEGSSQPASMPKARVPTVANIDLKDSTHRLVQNLRSYDIESIRSLSGFLIPTVRSGFENDEGTQSKGKKGKLVKFDSQEEKSTVEERLSLTIAKSDFGKMRIAGQFNLGFILATRLSEKGNDVNDLFIIDQHASDEKYNFERLQAETVVQNQPLVRPKVLELSAMDELVVMDNMDVLKKNGFVVEVDDEGLVGKRCRLVSLPMSKDKVFDLKDFEELLHLIREHPNDDSVRPSKVRAMFAMRACRSSIMIGRTLGLKDMKRVVKHMGELDKPWNCPHGRPTMRHLCDVEQLECWREDMDMAFAEAEAAIENEGEGVEHGEDEEYNEDGGEEGIGEDE